MQKKTLLSCSVSYGVNSGMEKFPAAEELAVKVRGAVKGYGSQLVLKGLNMDVPRGSM